MLIRRLAIFSGSRSPQTEAMHDLRSAVAARRRGNTSIGDLLYRVYITALGTLFGFYLALGLVDDATVDAGTIDWVRSHGASWVGAVAALALTAGIRSGANGGPLAIDEVELHHLVMSPIDRAAVLRSGVLRLVAAATGLGVVIGAASGELASRRLPGATGSWIGGAVVACTATILASTGAAFLAASSPVIRRRPWIITLISMTLVGWATLDVVANWRSAPTTVVGEVALWAMAFSWWHLAVPITAMVLLVGGIRRLPGLSIERAARRAHLVRQVRFALAQQDVRSLILLRRQLGFERPRAQPLFRLGIGRFEHRVPSMYRDFRSYLRWPLARMLRVTAMAMVGGLAAAGVWKGTTALAAAVAVVAYLSSLEAAEPFAQEIDHPYLLEAAPGDAPTVLVLHLVAATVLMTLWWLMVTVIAAVAAGSVQLAAVLAIVSIPAAAAGVAGAALSTKRVGSGISTLPVPDEIAGPQAVIKVLWPVAVAGLASLTIVLARDASSRGLDAIAASLPATIAVGLVAAALIVWVRVRDSLTDFAAASQRPS